MSLAPGCPRCASSVTRTEADGTWACHRHGEVAPLWRPDVPAYEEFVEHLALAGGFPTYLPWPLGPGWQVTDFAVVAGADGEDAAATLTSVCGDTAPDGQVEAQLVIEEAGVGLGARVAGTLGHDPGPTLGDRPPAARVRVGRQAAPLWPVSVTSDPGAAPDAAWDRSVLVGEAEGRWLWLVLRPASALLLLREEWTLRDASGLGPGLIELPFGPSGPAW